MRMFFYYFFHSAWNQIRSFIRTWAFLLFIVLFAAGGVIWYGFMWYYHRLAAANSELPADITEFFTVTHLNGLNILELAAGLLILGLLVIQAVLAERSVSGLFKQADVNLLFASDLSPQTVLSFRVTNTLGMGIVAALILAFRLPSIISRFSVTPYAAVSILISWCLLLAFSILLKILIYELGSRHPFFHRNLRWFLFAMLAVIGAAIYRMYSTAEDKELFSIAHRFFNAPGTRWIPIWGWIKGTMMYALEGNVPMSLCMLCLSIALISVLILLVGRLPADYYEETLTAAEEATLLNEEASSEGAALLVMRARKREVSREGFHHGTGSSVYFFRVFHNRIRTSPGYVSKTMLTYSFAALAAGFYVRFFLDNPIEYIHVLLLAVMVFFRTIISPVTEDIRKDTFFLQPEPVWKKLFFSLLGGSCNCAVDVAIPLMIGSMVAGFSPLRGILYLPMLMSVDFFASASGAFTDVSIPPSIGTSVKQVIQVILIYVGLVFDGAFLAYGINSGHSMAGFILVTVLDLLFGGTGKGEYLPDDGHGPVIQTLFAHLGLHVVQTDLVQLVDRDRDIDDLVRESRYLCKAGKDLAVVDLYQHVHVQEGKDLVDYLHEFQLVDLGLAPDHIHVALVEFTVAALLRTIGPPHGLYLESLERERYVILVLDHEAGERHGQVISEAFLTDLLRQCHGVDLPLGILEAVQVDLSEGIAGIQDPEQKLVTLLAIFAEQGG